MCLVRMIDSQSRKYIVVPLASQNLLVPAKPLPSLRISLARRPLRHPVLLILSRLRHRPARHSSPQTRQTLPALLPCSDNLAPLPHLHPQASLRPLRPPVKLLRRHLPPISLAPRAACPPLPIRSQPSPPVHSGNLRRPMLAAAPAFPCSVHQSLLRAMPNSRVHLF